MVSATDCVDVNMRQIATPYLLLPVSESQSCLRIDNHDNWRSCSQAKYRTPLQHGLPGRSMLKMGTVNDAAERHVRVIRSLGLILTLPTDN